MFGSLALSADPVPATRSSSAHHRTQEVFAPRAVLRIRCRANGPTPRVLGSPPVTQWVRLLSRVTSASAEWHVPRTKSFTTTTHCGTKLEGPIEVATDDKAEREGRCSSCVTHLATTRGIEPQRPSRPIAQAPRTSVARAAAKKTAAKKTAARVTIRKLAPERRSGSAPVAKRPVRRSRRSRA